MNVATWQAVLAIAGGSIAGALLRLVIVPVVDRANGSAQRAYVVTGVGGVIFGAAAGWLTSAELALFAALGTFAASGGLRTGTMLNERTFLGIASHIAVGILAAVMGFGIVVWLRPA